VRRDTVGAVCTRAAAMKKKKRTSRRLLNPIKLTERGNRGDSCHVHTSRKCSHWRRTGTGTPYNGLCIGLPFVTPEAISGGALVP
jgi:hypothetical protein